MSPYAKICLSPQKLTRQEQSLVAYIQAGYPNCLLDSATSIAKRVLVSPATVVRFFAKLGYASFHEMQHEVRLELTSRLPSPALRAAVPLGSESSSRDKIDAAFELDTQNVEATRAAIDAEEFKLLIDRILQPGRGTIYVAAAKNSRSMALYLATHLNMCVPGIQLLSSDPAELASSLLWVTPKDTLLAFSIRRYAKSTYQATREFRALGARVVTFTDSHEAPIVSLAHQNFHMFTQSDSPFDSCTAAFSLCTAIISSVVTRSRRKMQDTLERSEQIWSDFEVFVSSDSGRAPQQ